MRAPFRSLLALSCLALAFQAHAGRQALPPEQVKVNELLAETQKSSPNTATLDLVWWIPPQFWSSVMKGRGGGDPKTEKELTELFGKYTVVATVRGTMGTLGPQSFLSEAELRDQIRLVGTDGKRYSPIDADKIDTRLNTLIQMMHPMFANMLGQMGNNVHFFAFPASANGHPISDPLGDGHLVVDIASDQFDFRLPLGSLLVPQRDPQSGEVFPGSYRFNPYTGTGLQPVAPASQSTPASQ
jgi:hypothetical protein